MTLYPTAVVPIWLYKTKRDPSGLCRKVTLSTEPRCRHMEYRNYIMRGIHPPLTYHSVTGSNPVMTILVIVIETSLWFITCEDSACPADITAHVKKLLVILT